MLWHVAASIDAFHPVGMALVTEVQEDSSLNPKP